MAPSLTLREALGCIVCATRELKEWAVKVVIFLKAGVWAGERGIEVGSRGAKGDGSARVGGLTRPGFLTRVFVSGQFLCNKRGNAD